MSDVIGIGMTFAVGFGPIPDGVEGGEPFINLAGATIVCQARPKGATQDVTADAGLVDEGGLTARAEFSPAQTAGFSSGPCQIDAHAVMPSGKKVLLCRTFSLPAVALIST